MAVSTYDEQFLTDEQKRQVQLFTDAWNRANAAGDQAGMDAAHAAAERVRAQAGYSGGMDGSGYTGLGYGGQYGGGYYTDPYTPTKRAGYQAQTDAVNRMYDAARDAELAQLKSAFDANSADLEARRREIPGIYQARKNDAASEAELAARSFNEYAAASGLNSGSGGQARLAMSNQLQGELGALGQQEAAANLELENELGKLRSKYRDDIASAVASGEYKRASALLEEYRREEESRVSASNAMADDNYRAWQSRMEGDRYAYERSRDGINDSAGEWERQLELAELMAKYGDYSGLRALGVDTSGYEAAKSASGVTSSGSSGTRGSSGGGTSSGTGEWSSIYKQFRDAGVSTKAEAYDYALRALGFDRLEAEKYAEFFEETLKDESMKKAADVLTGAIGVLRGKSS